MKDWRILLASLVTLLAMIYAPIVAGAPKGWALYTYWLLTGLAAIAIAWSSGWARDG